MFQLTAARRRLVAGADNAAQSVGGFNSQPPEGGWPANRHSRNQSAVSTHSRPKAAGQWQQQQQAAQAVSTHSRPKAAGHDAGYRCAGTEVSTHSRPKAAGY